MSQFAIEERIIDQAHTVSIHGEFVVEHVSEADSALLRAASDSRRTLVVSLTDCEFVDTAAIATLHAAFRRAQGNAGMEIVAPRGSQVRGRLERTGLDRVIPTFDSLRAALVPASGEASTRTPTQLFAAWGRSPN